MKIVFFGTPEFAMPNLEALYHSKDMEILSVVTQPDKPQGRKKILTPPPVKILAKELNLKIIQPKNKKELINALSTLEKANFFVVIAFGMILPQEVLSMPKYGAINVHASLLPKYRGASPIQESLLNGDIETGISVIKIDQELDHGDIFLIKRLNIEKNDNFATLSVKLALLSSNLLPHLLHDIAGSHLSPIHQDHQKATYCHKITKEDGKINFSSSAEEIKNMINAYTPWPGVYTEFAGKKLKIISTEISDEKIQPGEFKIENKILKIGTKKGALIPTKLQPEGKKVMDAKAFINGIPTESREINKKF